MGQAKTLEDTKPAALSSEQSAAVRKHLQEVLSSEAFMGGIAHSISFSWW